MYSGNYSEPPATSDHHGHIWYVHQLNHRTGTLCFPGDEVATGAKEPGWSLDINNAQSGIHASRGVYYIDKNGDF